MRKKLQNDSRNENQDKRSRPHKGRSNIASLALLLVLLPLTATACVAPGDAMNSTTQSRVRAPEFPAGMEWLNTNAPLTMYELKGKVVLLDFWTYCCINCIHVIPDLKKLEAKYHDELVVVGVHSAKFTTEQETENIRQAVLRYEVEHPVVNDHDMQIWRTYGVRAWPTMVLIDPEGYAVGIHSGEGIYDLFDKAIGDLVEKFDAEGKIDRSPIAKIVPEMRSERRSLLSFPGKVLADSKSKRLFIADSNNNRIVIISLTDNSVSEVIGSGEAGLKDGSYAEATFDKPQGMTLEGDTLYVADTENHVIRRVDLAGKSVETIAGTGKQARVFNQSGPSLTTALNSPWDLLLHEGTLYIANAGSHQLWRMDLEKRFVEPHAGSARENRFDGPLLQAALAQPSGLSTDGKSLFFADSEVSAIRSASIDPDGRVETIAGGELFEFGDIDSKGLGARFQHPLGVAYLDGELFVADTYNNKIRRINIAQKRVSSFLGSGKQGFKDGKGDEVTFDEPGGLSIADGKLYIADTNNHLIRVADLKTRQVTTLIKPNMERLVASQSPVRLSDRTPVRLAPKSVSAGSEKLRFELTLPAGLKLNDLGPSTITYKLGDGEPQQLKDLSFPLEVTIDVPENDFNLRIDYAIYYCTDDNRGLCYFREKSLEVPVTVDGNAGSSDLTVTLEPDKR